MVDFLRDIELAYRKLHLISITNIKFGTRTQLLNHQRPARRLIAGATSECYISLIIKANILRQEGRWGWLPPLPPWYMECKPQGTQINIRGFLFGSESRAKDHIPHTDILVTDQRSCKFLYFYFYPCVGGEVRNGS